MTPTLCCVAACVFEGKQIFKATSPKTLINLHVAFSSVPEHNIYTVYTTESVDSISRDGPDTPILSLHYN